MTSPKSKRKPVSTIDVRQVAADLDAWLEGGGEPPALLAALTPRQYVDALAALQKRIQTLAMSRPVTPDRSAMQVLLANCTNLPASKAGTEARAAAVKFAAVVDPRGDMAAAVLGQALLGMEPTAAAADLFVHRAGPLLDGLSRVAASWAEARDESRPTSVQSAALARLLAAQLASLPKGTNSADGEQAAILEGIANSLRSIRVKDHQGSLDPLLLGIASAVAMAAEVRPARDPDTSPPLAETEALKRERLLGSFRELFRWMESQLEAAAKLEDQLRGARMESASLRQQRDGFEQKTADLQNQVGRLSGQLSATRIQATEAESAMAAANVDSERWRRESAQAHIDATTEIREKVARAGRDMLQILERYGSPAMAVIEQREVVADDLASLRVNLRNLIQKLTSQAHTMMAPPDDSRRKDVTTETRRTDETRN